MNILVALMLFGIAAYPASIVLDGWRAGKMPAPFWRGSNPPAFDRITSPAWFWGATGINAALAAVLAISGIFVLAASLVRK